MEADNREIFSEIMKIEFETVQNIRNLVNINKDINPIDNIHNYTEKRLPLQIIYSLDQRYLTRNLISKIKTKA